MASGHWSPVRQENANSSQDESLQVSRAPSGTQSQSAQTTWPSDERRHQEMMGSGADHGQDARVEDLMVQPCCPLQ